MCLKTRTVLLAAVVMAILPAAALARYEAELTADQCVPPSASTATGNATFRPNRNETELTSRVRVNELNNDGMLAVALYMGTPDDHAMPDMLIANLPLTRSLKKGIINGVLCSYTLTADDLTGPLAGKPLSALIALMADGGVFVNVISGSYPQGEIRGQIY